MHRILVVTVVVCVLLVPAACRNGCSRHFGTRPAREAALRDDLFEMRKAIDNFYADKKRYPVSLDELVASKYLRTVPADPITESRKTWVTAGNGEAVFDVR